MDGNLVRFPGSERVLETLDWNIVRVLISLAEIQSLKHLDGNLVRFSGSERVGNSGLEYSKISDQFGRDSVPEISGRKFGKISWI